MAKKFYAVKNGKTPGIFETWDECKKSVDGYSGAVFKSFKTKDEALAFLGIESSSNSGIPIDVDGSIASDSSCATAYVDGSYNIATKEFGYGVVMFHNGEELHMSKSFSDAEMASMRNVAGEILGSMAAVKKAIELGLKDISIFYDYAGIKAWAVGEWKRNKKGTIEYYNYITSVRDSINIRFVKVRGHSGVEGNEEADRLAKRAVGCVSLYFQVAVCQNISLIFYELCGS